MCSYQYMKYKIYSTLVIKIFLVTPLYFALTYLFHKYYNWLKKTYGNFNLKRKKFTMFNSSVSKILILSNEVRDTSLDTS